MDILMSILLIFVFAWWISQAVIRLLNGNFYRFGLNLGMAIVSAVQLVRWVLL